MTTQNQTLPEHLQPIIQSPKHRGALFEFEAEERGYVFVEAKKNSLKIYLNFDPNLDQIVDIRFFTYGGPWYTLIAEKLCEACAGLKLNELSQITNVMIEKKLHPDSAELLLDTEAEPYILPEILLQKVIEDYPERKKIALGAVESMKRKNAAPPPTFEAKREQDQKWLEASKEDRLVWVEEVLDEHVRQGLNMDGGDMEVLDIVGDHRLKVKYMGACSGCGASTGGTLFFIENTLREHCFHEIVVEPDSEAYENPY